MPCECAVAAKYGSTSKSKPVTGAARKLIDALSERLSTTDAERQAETSAYNKKLLQAEQQHCDWFVEKRLMEERISSLTAQVAERDEIEDKMELCVHSLFERLRQLEITNHNLRRKLGMATGRGITPDLGSTGRRTGTPDSMAGDVGASSSGPESPMRLTGDPPGRRRSSDTDGKADA